MTPAARVRLARAFALQAYWCKALGSPFYARLASECALGLERDAPLRRTLAPFADDAPGTVLPLRFLGALHRLALEGAAPELAAHYPSCGGDDDAAAAGRHLDTVTERLGDRLAALIQQSVQTNEVGRAAALLGGFLEIAETTGLPLRLLELGASAGLLLRFDRYRYGCGAWAWGDAQAEVVLDAHFAEPLPFAQTALHVASRRGCDLRPIDAATPEGRLRLRSYVWPDQRERLALLDAAVRVARRLEATVDREPAGTWLARQLAAPVSGVATVVVHTVVMQYVPAAERGAIDATIARAGAAATPDAPLARLSLEPRPGPSVVVQRFPGDASERGIAEATMHGRNVRWIAPAPDVDFDLLRSTGG